jgi:hypothetical protein
LAQQILPIIPDDAAPETDALIAKTTTDAAASEHEETDPVILAAVARAKVVRTLMGHAITKHLELPDQKRPCCAGTDRVVLNGLDGLRVTAHVDLNVKVGQLARCRSLYEGFAPEQLRFLYRGAPLVCDISLARQGVTSGATLHLIVQMRGS